MCSDDSKTSRQTKWLVHWLYLLFNISTILLYQCLVCDFFEVFYIYFMMWTYTHILCLLFYILKKSNICHCGCLEPISIFFIIPKHQVRHNSEWIGFNLIFMIPISLLYQCCFITVGSFFYILYLISMFSNQNSYFQIYVNIFWSIWSIIFIVTIVWSHNQHCQDDFNITFW